MTIQGIGTAKGRFDYRKPNYQRFRLFNPKMDEEFHQSPDASILFDHRGKNYTWYTGLDKLEQAPPDADPLLRFGSPNLLAMGSLSAIAQKARWANKGKATVDGHKTDVIALKPEVNGGVETVTLWIDTFGKILKLKTVIETQGGIVQAVVQFTNPSNQAPPVTAFASKVPWGYSPTQAVRLTATHFTTDEIELNKAVLWPSGQEKALSGRVVVLMTSNDLADQSDLAPWKPLAERAKAEGADFVQIWLGARPSSQSPNWDTVWDKDATWESKLGPPVTPYVMVFDKGTFVSGWQGWPNDQTQDMLAVLFKPFKKN